MGKVRPHHAETQVASPVADHFAPEREEKSTQHSSARLVTFPGHAIDGEPAPELEGRLAVPADGILHPGVVLCHANPAAGGSMDMKLMLAIESVLAEHGTATLRYNSRGIGNSGGSVSQAPGKTLVAPEGTAETADIGAALTFLGMQEGVDASRLALVGHSFGARIILAFLASNPQEMEIRAIVCIGLPVAWRDLSHYGQWPHPKLFVTGEKDDFCPPDRLAEFVADLPDSATMVTLRNTGHFFEGREQDLADAVATFLRQVLAG
ncbi:MAG: alpha/beta fold hydrolase [Chloroflexia bacterium]